MCCACVGAARGCNILLSFSHGQGTCVSLECAQCLQHSPGMGELSIITPQGTVVSCSGVPETLLKCGMPSDKCWRETLGKGME